MPPPSGEAGAFLGSLASAGYFFPFLKATELVVGILLLSRRFVPLALTILAPISLNILAFHLFLAPEGLPLAVIVVILHASLAWHHRDAYRSLFAGSQEASSDVQHSSRLSHSI